MFKSWSIRRIFMIAIVLLQSWVSFAYYGFRTDPTKWGTNVVESTFVPINYEVCRLTQPDQTVRYLYRDRENPSRLLAQDPWEGYSEYGRTTVRTRDDFTGGQTEFEFYNGTLRKMTFDREQMVVKRIKPVQSDEAIPKLWEQKQRGMLDDVTSVDIWKESGRFRIPFGEFINPNKTAAIFMMLSVMFLSVALVLFHGRRLILGMVAVIPFLASLVFLFLTQSRGCLLGFVLGIVSLIVPHFREFKDLFSFRRILVALLLLVALGGIAFKFGGTRFTSGFLAQDPRTDRRTMWAAVPRMMADAPTGWGYGNGGRAYVDWYQSFDTPLAVSELQNSHLTWLVEMGCMERVGYVFAWLFFMFLFAVWAFRDKKSLPFAVFVAFGVSACFTHELEEPLLWVLPIFSLVSGFKDFRPFGRRVILVAVCMAVVISLGAVVVVGIWGRNCRQLVSIKGFPDHVLLNGEDPKVWIVGDDAVLDGGYQIYQGKEMRQFFQSHTNAPAIAFVRKLSALPDKTRTLVLAGWRGAEYLETFNRQDHGLCIPEKLIFLSPPFSWKKIDESLQKKMEVRVILGRLAGRLSSDYDLPPSWVEQVPGAELYIPNWLDLVTKEGN
ncbi:MAG: O-antigen ligase family protein [Kiritimatiellae bacterium]|nr:O-antigen ligase family protein [Kiritimatiellia bacterium]